MSLPSLHSSLTFLPLFLHRKQNKSIVISIVAGVPAIKISKLLGLTRVLRTFVDIQQLPVAWSAGLKERQEAEDSRVPPTPGGSSLVDPKSLDPEFCMVAAKSYVAESGQLNFMQAAIEELAEDMGVERKDAKFLSCFSVVGEGMNKKDRKIGTMNNMEWLMDGLDKPMKVWEEKLATHFWEIFSEEVFAKDMPSFLSGE